MKKVVNSTTKDETIDLKLIWFDSLQSTNAAQSYKT
jgi:hypothetical protein